MSASDVMQASWCTKTPLKFTSTPLRGILLGMDSMKEPSSATPTLAIIVVIVFVGESFRAFLKKEHREA
jgi:hypothetical protein